MQIKKAILCSLLAILAGCTSLEPTRSQKFVDESNRYVMVDYGSENEPRVSTFTLSNGVKLPFKSKLKVRVELPNGKRFIAYQHMSQTGNLYVTDDGEYEYFEQATGCVVARRAKDGDGYLIQFQGVLCASVRNPFVERRQAVREGSSTPHGFGRESTGPRDVTEK